MPEFNNEGFSPLATAFAIMAIAKIDKYNTQQELDELRESIIRLENLNAKV